MLHNPVGSLTLIAARFGGAHFTGPQTPQFSALIASYPSAPSISWEHAPEALAAASLPLVVSSLPSGTGLVCWTLSMLTASQRAHVEAGLANAPSYLGAKAQHLGLTAASPVVVAIDGTEEVTTLGDIMAWLGSIVMLSTGVTLLSHGGKTWLALLALDGTSNVPFNPFDATHGKCAV